jgi:hypothetical protein
MAAEHMPARAGGPSPSHAQPSILPDEEISISWHNGRVMSSHRRSLHAVLSLVIAGLLGGGCARPYAGPKTLAALGVGLLAAGGTTWVVGERQDRNGVATAGMVTTLLGAAAAVAAGGWLASGVACAEDPDCPRSEECREIPTRPGGVPYRQCMPR